MPRIAQMRTSSEPPVPGAWTRWFALMGGAVAWTGHIMLCYIVAEFGCIGGLGEMRVAGLTATAWLLIGVSIAMLLLSAAATRAGYAGMRRGESVVNGGPADAAEYLCRAGLIASGLFAVIILVQSGPIVFYLHRC